MADTEVVTHLHTRSQNTQLTGLQPSPCSACRIGADEIKGYNLPSDKLSHLLKWHEEMKSRPSWKNTAPDSEQYVRDGWQVGLHSGGPRNTVASNNRKAGPC